MFAHCAPKGTPHAIEGTTASSIGGHKLERLAIRRDHCGTCIHDYHSDWTPREAWIRSSEARYDKVMYGFAESVFPDEELPAREFNLRKAKKILFVGWYGTETAGDIAILEGIMIEYLKVNRNLQFGVLSFNPFYTRNNISEFAPALAEVIRVMPYHGYEAHEAILASDAIVMAGGPLMDIAETKIIADLFLFGSQMNKHLIIEGCGVGPLHKKEYEKNVVRTLRLATRIAVRDSQSKRMIQSYAIRKEITVRPDPSTTYVGTTGMIHAGTQSKLIRCFLRELTHEYPQEITASEAAANMAVFMKNLLDWFPECTIELVAMHYFPVGQDDRIYAKALQERVNDSRMVIDIKPRTPQDILAAMVEARFCVCMRLHSVIFASSIKAPYVAIDYTSGGKVAAYLEDINRSAKALPLKRVAEIEKPEFERVLAA
jgi:polysaccharide pyruvyl transferase WcaK-like protein